jgi:hypothetical protein
MCYVNPVVRKLRKVGHNMSFTFQEVCEELSKLDETTLLEVLNITSDEIVNKFQDKIEEDLESLAIDLEYEKDITLNLFTKDND